MPKPIQLGKPHFGGTRDPSLTCASYPPCASRTETAEQEIPELSGQGGPDETHFGELSAFALCILVTSGGRSALINRTASRHGQTGWPRSKTQARRYEPWVDMAPAKENRIGVARCTFVQRLASAREPRTQTPSLIGTRRQYARPRLPGCLSLFKPALWRSSTP